MPAGFHVVLLNPVTSFVEVFTLTLPAFNPVFVKVLVPTLTSLFFMLAEPVVTLPVGPKLISLASLTVSVSPLATTPILLSVRSVVLPPLIFRVLPNVRATLPESAAKVSGFTTSAFKFDKAVPTLFAAV